MPVLHGFSGAACPAGTDCFSIGQVENLPDFSFHILAKMCLN